MSDSEQFQATNDFERASKAMRAESELIDGARGEIKSEENASELERTIAAYEQVQAKIVELRNNYKRCVNDALALRNENPAKADLLALISEAIDEEMAEKLKAKTELEKKIMKAGDEPSRYSMQ